MQEMLLMSGEAKIKQVMNQPSHDIGAFKEPPLNPSVMYVYVFVCSVCTCIHGVCSMHIVHVFAIICILCVCMSVHECVCSPA